MKVLLCLVILFTLGSSQSLTWKEYNERFGKTYEGVEHNQRMVFFTNQHNLIVAHNKQFEAGAQTFKMDYNALTDSGFAYNFNQCFKPIIWSNFPKGTPISVDTNNLPKSFELETKGVLVTDHSEYFKTS